MILLCTALDPGRSFTLEGDHLFQGKVPFRVRLDTALRATAAGVRLLLRTRISAPGPYSWLIAWLISGPARTMQRRELEQLKQALEEMLAPA